MLSNIRIPVWEKKGKIYSREGGSFFKTHAMRVIPFLRKNKVLRLFFSSRCVEDMMHPTYIDVNPDNPSEIIYVSEKPLMSLGNPGTFDDSGITMGSIVRHGTKTYCYYTGWKRRRYNVPFELSIGVAEIMSDGDEFIKLYQGPILSQDIAHPYLVGGPFVLNINGQFRMWYCSGTSWVMGEAGFEPTYTVFHAESKDGVSWNQTSNIPCIKKINDREVVSAPWVTVRSGGYLMYYPFRGSETPLLKRYSIGVAASLDGITWTRMDALAGIVKSEAGWDSEMICYPATFTHKAKEYLFYSGNGVGMGGIGYAEAQ
jgi:hypothetical protein